MAPLNPTVSMLFLDQVIPFIGYLASIFLAISLLVNNDLKFRWINSFGNICFLVYGIFIEAYPIILTNSVLLLINIYYLFKIYNTKENFDLVEFPAADQLINKFLAFHQEDIKLYFPQFYNPDPTDEIRFAVLRDMVIANIFIAKLCSDGSAEVKLNYTVARYRDYQVGRFIFEKEKKYLCSKGVSEIIYRQIVNKNHEKFLGVMGFTKEFNDGKTAFRKRL